MINKPSGQLIVDGLQMTGELKRVSGIPPAQRSSEISK